MLGWQKVIKRMSLQQVACPYDARQIKQWRSSRDRQSSQPASQCDGNLRELLILESTLRPRRRAPTWFYVSSYKRASPAEGNWLSAMFEPQNSFTNVTE